MREPTRLTERIRIERSFDVFHVGEAERAEIMEALDSEEWDWFADSDGCTAVSEMHWPTKYFPPCVRHDFDWRYRDGGMEATKRFYRLQRAYGMSKFRSGLRCTGVTLAWYGLCKWKKALDAKLRRD